MNIFVLDKDPVLAAQMLCDRHVSKMILETAQMLSSVADRYGFITLYKPAYKNHPCTLWAGDEYVNWKWLVDHAIAMNEEKIFRTGKSHASFKVIEFYYKNLYGPPKNIFNEFPENFAMAMPEYLKEKYKDNPVDGYRKYYLLEKQFFKDGKRPTWKKRMPPEWWVYNK